MSDCAKEATWLRGLLSELKVCSNLTPTIINCDNQSSIKLAKNPVFHARTKHIEVHYHHVRDKVLSKVIDLQHVGTLGQSADILTKALGRQLFEKHRTSLKLVET